MTRMDFTQSQSLTALSNALQGPVAARYAETIDAVAGVSTSYTIASGDTFSGYISSGDEDWVGVYLNAGTTYSIAVSGLGGGGGTLDDSVMGIANASGIILASDDDGGPGYDSALNFTPTSSGYYYVAVVGYDSSSIGSYTMSVSESVPAAPGTLDEMATYLTNGFWADQGESAAHYDTRSSNVVTYNLTGLTFAGQQLARWALEAWELVADLDFVEVSSGGDIVFQDHDSGAYSTFVTNSQGYITSSMVNISTNWIAAYGTTIDSYSYSTYVHEIGHAIGLGHQGNYNGNATYGVDETFSNDSYQLSIMSYFSQTDNTTVNASYAEPITPMMVDIIAAQNLYGAPNASSETAGNTTWGVGTNLGGAMGHVGDILAGTAPASIYAGGPITYTIYDRGGFDTLNLSASSSNNRVDLNDESFSDIEGLTGNLAIARGTMIERVWTGAGNDTVTGNEADNHILLGAGHDLAYGGAGNDWLRGDDGYDTLYGGAGDDVLGGGIFSDVLYGGDGNDGLWSGKNHDTLNGGAGDDTLGANHGSDLLNGDDGNDDLRGGGGSDTLNGGNGNDLLNGSYGDDLLYGDTGNDTLDGNIGNDTMNGGVGNDRLFGGWGNDTLTGDAGADTFIFGGAFGNDVVTDFDPSENDMLRLNDNMWSATHGTLTAAEVISTFGSTSGGDLVLTFDSGVLTLTGHAATAGLESYIDIY